MSDQKDDIEKYHKGELSPSEMHALEKRALSDPLLSDALEGAGSIPSNEFASDVRALQEKISKEQRGFSITPLRIAAGIIVVIGISFFVLLINFGQKEVPLASKTESAQGQTSPAVSADSTFNTQSPAEKAAGEPKDESLLSLNDQNNSKNKKQKPTEPVVVPDPAVATATQPLDKNPTDADDDVADEILLAEAEKALQENEEAKIAANEPQEVTRAKRAERAEGLVRTIVPSVSSGAPLQNKLNKVISGQVLSEEDGLPLPGVNVVAKREGRGTSTDINGRYSIPLQQDSAELTFSFVGMQTHEVLAKDQLTLDVKLKEDISQLSEVVVTGLAPYKDSRDDRDGPLIKLAEPVGGLKAYDQYLENSLQYPLLALEQNIKGRVSIQFTVGTDGSLGDFEVLKSLGYGCDDEVMRLVKEGPKWMPTTENATAVESRVRVRMKFDPAKAKK